MLDFVNENKSQPKTVNIWKLLYTEILGGNMGQSLSQLTPNVVYKLFYC